MDLWPEKAGPRQPVDSSRGPTLTALLRANPGNRRRILGCACFIRHPAHWSDELVATIAECDKVARYIDIPLQHIDGRCCNACGGKPHAIHIENLIDKFARRHSGLALRTTFIVGFPGEN